MITAPIQMLIYNKETPFDLNTLNFTVRSKIKKITRIDPITKKNYQYWYPTFGSQFSTLNCGEIYIIESKSTNFNLTNDNSDDGLVELNSYDKNICPITPTPTPTPTRAPTPTPTVAPTQTASPIPNDKSVRNLRAIRLNCNDTAYYVDWILPTNNSSIFRYDLDMLEGDYSPWRTVASVDAKTTMVTKGIFPIKQTDDMISAYNQTRLFRVRSVDINNNYHYSNPVTFIEGTGLSPLSASYSSSNPQPINTSSSVTRDITLRWVRPSPMPGFTLKNQIITVPVPYYPTLTFTVPPTASSYTFPFTERATGSSSPIYYCYRIEAVYTNGIITNGTTIGACISGRGYKPFISGVYRLSTTSVKLCWDYQWGFFGYPVNVNHIIQYSSDGKNWTTCSTTAKNGEITIEGLPPGSYYFLIAGIWDAIGEWSLWPYGPTKL